MDKASDVTIRDNHWQRLLKWQRGKKVNKEGEDGVKDEEKHNTKLNQKLKVKWVINGWVDIFTNNEYF